jgi:hypothetical protein
LISDTTQRIGSTRVITLIVSDTLKRKLFRKTHYAQSKEFHQRVIILNLIINIIYF